MSIATLAEFKQFAAVTSDERDVDIQRGIDTATLAIESACGRRFSKDPADVTRYYYPGRDGVIDLVDLISVTTLKVDTSGNRTYGTTLATTDYELLPMNGDRYDRIRIWPQSSKGFAYGRRVQVVGRFGYVDANDSPPADIVQACLILVNRYYNRRANPFGILQTPDLGQYTRISAEDPDVKALLKPYVLKGGAWVLV